MIRALRAPFEIENQKGLNSIEKRPYIILNQVHIPYNHISLSGEKIYDN